jgi:hypothetical protein
MAEKVGLSKARFYQLLKAGVFPPPDHNTHTKRPLYPPELQQKCIQIRKMGIGFDGLPVLFNQPRKAVKAQSLLGHKYRGYALTLRTMGLNVTASQVKDAIDVLSAKGVLQSSDENLVVRDLFRHMSTECTKSVQFP